MTDPDDEASIQQMRAEFLEMIDKGKLKLDHPFKTAQKMISEDNDTNAANNEALGALPHWTLQARQAGGEILLKYVDAKGNPLRAVVPSLAALCGYKIEDEADFQAFAAEEPQILSVFYGLLDWFDLLLEASEEIGQSVRSMMITHMQHTRPGVSFSDRQGKLGDWTPGFGPLRE